MDQKATQEASGASQTNNGAKQRTCRILHLPGATTQSRRGDAHGAEPARNMRRHTTLSSADWLQSHQEHETTVSKLRYRRRFRRRARRRRSPPAGPDESPSALLHSHHEEVPRVHPRLMLNHLPAHRKARFPVVFIRVLNFVWQKISDMAEITKFREISAEIHF